MNEGPNTGWLNRNPKWFQVVGLDIAVLALLFFMFQWILNSEETKHGLRNDLLESKFNRKVDEINVEIANIKEVLAEMKQKTK